MSDFSYSVDINASADEVFKFVSNPENMPRYLPTIENARLVGSDKVLIEGTAGGQHYRVEGEFHLEPDERLMHWSSEEHHRYHGELAIVDNSGACKLTAGLVFEDESYIDDKIRSRQKVQDALEGALGSIKEICEGSRVEKKPYLS